MSDILTGTPPNLTYAHHLVQQAWTVAWAVIGASAARWGRTPQRRWALAPIRPCPAATQSDL